MYVCVHICIEYVYMYLYGVCVCVCLECTCAGSHSCVWRPELTSGIISEDTAYLIFF